MMRVVPRVAAWAAISGLAAATADTTCDAESGTCAAQETSGSAMMQMKVKRAQNTLQTKVHSSSEGRIPLDKVIQLQLQAHKTNRIKYHTVSYKKHKQRKLVQALEKHKQGLLSKHASDVLTAALKKAKKIEHKNDEAMNPFTDNKTAEMVNHSTIEEVLEDGTDDAFTKHHEAVMRALEEFSETTSVEDAAKDGTVFTEDDAEEIFGIPETPMQTCQKGVQGDMVGSTDEDKASLLQASKNGVRWYGRLWEDKGAMKYCFANDISSTSRQAWLDAIQHFRNMVPCLGFKEVGVGSDADQKCAEQPAIFVQSREPGCWAHVGQPYHYTWDDSWSASVCNLSPGGCDTIGIAAHELGHNLGMMHEQARQDSGDYVRILWDNIQEAYVSQYTREDGIDQSLPYDIMSLMHYSDTSFGKYDANGHKMKTMESVDGSASVMGNYMGLTSLDAQQLGSMYDCLDAVSDFKMCTNDPEKCTMEDCGCHQDPSGTSEKIKTTDSSGCNRCLARCPDSPYGTAGVCGCIEGMTKSCFTSGGKEYCGCEAPPPPTPAPTTPPPTPAPEPDAEPSGQCKPDAEWWCEYFTKSDCGPLFYVNGLPILEGCATMCGLCDSPPPCFDLCSSTCALYATYCDDATYPGVTLSGTLFPEACPVTCGRSCR